MRYALGTAVLVTHERLDAPTPCRGWDLQMLLLHASESLAALTEGFEDGHIGLDPGGIGPADPAADPAAGFRQRARSLLGSLCLGSRLTDVATIAGCPMATDVLASAGALEVAVHGWDIARACGSRWPIPAALAGELLRAAPLLISPEDRQQLFAAPVSVGPDASPSDSLVAYLGRPPA